MKELIVQTVYGSRLYGTQHPDSDYDYRQVFVASLEDLIFNQVDTVRQQAVVGDKENDVTGVHIIRFMKWLIAGQPEAHSMLFTPRDQILITSAAWEDLLNHRGQLISKQVNPYFGFAYNQLRKPGESGKNLYHAYRTLQELKELVTTRQITYPRPEADRLMAIKYQQVSAETVQQWILESLMECRHLVDSSDLPDQIDVEWLRGWVVATYRLHLRLHLDKLQCLR